jgi:hypothetical protein
VGQGRHSVTRTRRALCTVCSACNCVPLAACAVEPPAHLHRCAPACCAPAGQTLTRYPTPQPEGRARAALQLTGATLLAGGCAACRRPCARRARRPRSAACSGRRPARRCRARASPWAACGRACGARRSLARCAWPPRRAPPARRRSRSCPFRPAGLAHLDTGCARQSPARGAPRRSFGPEPAPPTRRTSARRRARARRACCAPWTGRPAPRPGLRGGGTRRDRRVRRAGPAARRPSASRALRRMRQAKTLTPTLKGLRAAATDLARAGRAAATTAWRREAGPGPRPSGPGGLARCWAERRAQHGSCAP